MVLLSKAFTGVPPLQLTEQPHFMRLRSIVAWEVMWRHSGPFGWLSRSSLLQQSRVPWRWPVRGGRRSQCRCPAPPLPLRSTFTLSWQVIGSTAPGLTNGLEP